MILAVGIILLALSTAAAGLLVGLVAGFMAGAKMIQDDGDADRYKPIGSQESNPFTDGPQPRSEMQQP